MRRMRAVLAGLGLIAIGLFLPTTAGAQCAKCYLGACAWGPFANAHWACADKEGLCAVALAGCGGGGKTEEQLVFTADGFVATSGLGLLAVWTTSAIEGISVTRTCKGFIAARQFTPEAQRKLRAIMRKILV